MNGHRGGAQSYCDLRKLNTSHLILDSLGAPVLPEIVGDFLTPPGTSSLLPLCMKTVSYTHLDVYKRQVLDERGIVLDVSDGIFQRLLAERPIAGSAKPFRPAQIGVAERAGAIQQFRGAALGFRKGLYNEFD